MVKISIISIFLMLISFTTFATDLVFGGAASYSAGWFSGEGWDNFVDNNYEKNNISAGLSFGLFLDICFSENFSIQPEINYLLTSGKTSATAYNSDIGEYVTAELTEISKFITFPILAKFKINFNNKSNWTFVGGPQVSFLLGDIKERFSLSAEGYQSNASSSSLTADNTFYLGAVAGTGYEFKLRKNVFFTDLRYTHIFTSFFDNLDTMLNNLEFKVGLGTKI